MVFVAFIVCFCFYIFYRRTIGKLGICKQLFAFIVDWLAFSTPHFVPDFVNHPTTIPLFLLLGMRMEFQFIFDFCAFSVAVGKWSSRSMEKMPKLVDTIDTSSSECTFSKTMGRGFKSFCPCQKTRNVHSGVPCFFCAWAGGLEGRAVQSGLPVDVRDRERPRRVVRARISDGLIL